MATVTTSGGPDPDHSGTLAAYIFLGGALPLAIAAVIGAGAVRTALIVIGGLFWIAGVIIGARWVVRTYGLPRWMVWPFAKARARYRSARDKTRTRLFGEVVLIWEERAIDGSTLTHWDCPICERNGQIITNWNTETCAACGNTLSKYGRIKDKRQDP
jgi:hypothetical protein